MVCTQTTTNAATPLQGYHNISPLPLQIKYNKLITEQASQTQKLYHDFPVEFPKGHKLQVTNSQVDCVVKWLDRFPVIFRG